MSRSVHDAILSAGLHEFRQKVPGLIADTSHAVLIDEALGLFHAYALKIEAELVACRIAVDRLERREIANQAVTDAIRARSTDPEGKIVRPDFGGKP